MKLKSELISIKFQQFFDTLANPKLICPIQTIPLTCKLKIEAKFEYPLSDFGSFSYFQTSLSLRVEQNLQKLQKIDINDLKLLFQCYILIPRKCPRKTPLKTQWGGGAIMHEKLLNDYQISDYQKSTSKMKSTM